MAASKPTDPRFKATELYHESMMASEESTKRIDFLAAQLKILRSAVPWPGIEAEIAEKEAELRQCLIEADV